MEPLPFGTLTTADAVGRRAVDLVTLHSSAMTVSVLTFGASIHTVEVPDRQGRLDQVCLSMPTLTDYEDRARNAYLGATCGRYASRIGGASFSLDGHHIILEPNDGPNHLHGGPDGFARRIWDLVEATVGDDGGRVVLALASPDGDQGYPGNLEATATYELHGHHLRIVYEATTDAPTAVNLCNHAYWNLGGAGRWTLDGSIADHELRIPGAHVLPADSSSMPVGPLAHVDSTSLDLRHPQLLHDVLGAHHHGIDNSFSVDAEHGSSAIPGAMHVAADLHHPASGRTLTVSTDQPAVHVYTGNKLGAPFAQRSGLCLETQRYPDAPNRPDLGDPFLRPGEHYRSTTELTFGVR